MAFFRWTKNRGYGCAVEGDECLAVSVRYRPSERRLSVDDAWFGVLSDKAFTARLARWMWRRPLWVPLMFASDAERSDVKICAIDEADGRIKKRRLSVAVETQLKGVEVNKGGSYIRTHSVFEPKGGRRHVVGASAPEATVKKTVELWTRCGVIKPCVGSMRAALVNVFLALHPDAPAAEPFHRLLAYRSKDSDIFCYLQGQALMDTGASPLMDETTERLLDHLGEWGGEFAKKYQLTRNDLVRAYVLSGEPIAVAPELHPQVPLEFWTLPWNDLVDFSTAQVKETTLNHSRLALPAVGLALHGV